MWASSWSFVLDLIVYTSDHLFYAKFLLVISSYLSSCKIMHLYGCFFNFMELFFQFFSIKIYSYIQLL